MSPLQNQMHNTCIIISGHPILPSRFYFYFRFIFSSILHCCIVDKNICCYCDKNQCKIFRGQHQNWHRASHGLELLVEIFSLNPCFRENKCNFGLNCQNFCHQWIIFVAILMDLVPVARLANCRWGPMMYANYLKSVIKNKKYWYCNEHTGAPCSIISIPVLPVL